MGSRRELETHIMLYLHQRVLNGQLSECLDLGLDMAALRLIRKLNIAALAHLDTRKRTGIMASLVIDTQALASLTAALEQTAQQEAVIEQLLTNGASTALVKHFFGISRQDIYQRKQLLGLPATSRGRGVRYRPTQTEERRVLQHLHTLLAEVDDQARCCAQRQCQLLLQVAEATQLSVNAVWAVTERQALRGGFSWRDPRPGTTLPRPAQSSQATQR